MIFGISYNISIKDFSSISLVVVSCHSTLVLSLVFDAFLSFVIFSIHKSTFISLSLHISAVIKTQIMYQDQKSKYKER